MVLIEYLLVGVIGSLLLIVVAKGFMAKAMQRDTNYYEDDFDKFASPAEGDKVGIAPEAEGGEKHE